MILERTEVSNPRRPFDRPVGGDARFAVLVGLLLLGLSSLPYLFGLLVANADRAFMGLAFSAADYGQYLSWARESADRVFIENKLTSEQYPARFFNLVWWLVGRTERLTGLTFMQVNQLFRVVATVVYLWAAYRFCGAMFADRGRRRFALLLACFASGLGWLLVLAKPWTGDLALPLLVHNMLANTFFSVMVLPHHVLAAGVLVALILQVLGAYQRRCSRRMAAAGLLGLLLGLLHTYDLVLAYAVVGLFGLLVALRDGPRRRWLLGLGLFYGLSAPAPLYWAYVSASSPDWRQVLAQYANLGVFTPDPLQLVVLLGLPLILAGATFRGFVPLASRTTEELLLSSWFAVNLLVIYLPTNFQIMMLNGFQVALAVLATRGLYDHVLPWLLGVVAAYGGPLRRLPATRLHSLGLALFFLAVLPTNLYLLGWRIVDLGRRDYPYFLARSDVAALDWLEAHAAPSDVVLSSIEVGHYLPGATGAHAFLAHGANTLDFYRKRAAVERFFQPATSDDERHRVLTEYGVGYVFYGPAEQRLGQFDPRTATYLRPVFESQATNIYQVR